MTSDESVVVECHGLQLSKESLDAIQDERVFVSIPYRDIVRVTVSFGVASERTVLAIVIAIVLIAISLVFLVQVVDWFLHGGVAYKAEFLMLLLGPFGVWLIFHVLRKRFYLLVRTEHDVRKLPFGKLASRAEVEGFVDRIRLSIRGAIQNELA